MLHLVVIGIVCAVYAPIEDTTFFIGKNNESNVFGNFGGGEQNIVSLPNVYDVVVRNSSECAWNKITNKTNSFFNEYIIKQYRDNKNSSCSIMESVSSGKNKKLRSKVGFHYRKKRNVSSNRKLPKTLRPPLACREKLRKSSLLKNLKSNPEKQNKKCKFGLNCSERKMFFQLLHPLQRKKAYKGRKRHLDRLKVDDELDLNKRIEKLVKQIALENQRKENTTKEMILSVGIQDNDVESGLFEEKPPKKSLSLPFFNHIKKMFRFSKNNFNNKLNGVNSVPVSSVRGKDLVSNKAAHISSYDLKTMRKTTRFRRNPNVYHLPNRFNGKTVHKKELIEKTYPHSAHIKRKRHISCHRINRKLTSGYKKRRHRNMKGRKARRRGRKVKNWPLFKLNKNRNPDSTLTHNDPFKNREKFPAKRGANGRTSSPLITSSEDIVVNSVNKFNITDDIEKEYSPDQTLEKPFLKRNLQNRISGGSMHLDYSLFTQSPLNLINLQSTSKYKYVLRNEENLTPNRYLQIRHALRSYLFHNNIQYKDSYVQLKNNNVLLKKNILTPVKRNAKPDRSKRCRKYCFKNRKCWRSPPLLCIPYIKKGQEDQLRYIIRILQSMAGKPFPPKVDIFDRTKYKPLIKEKDTPCDYPQTDDYFYYPVEGKISNKNYTYAAPMSCPPIPPLTCAPPTPLPPTTFPLTPLPPTTLPLTPLPPTTLSPTTLPLTPLPPTSLPPTPLSPTSLPPTPLPPTTLPPTYASTTYPSVCPPFSQCASRSMSPYQGGSETLNPTPSKLEYTESLPLATELPFSFPILGRGNDKTTNFEGITTGQPPSPLSPTSVCHTLPKQPLPLNPYVAPPPPQPQLPSTPTLCPASPPIPACNNPLPRTLAAPYKILTSPGKQCPITEGSLEQKEYFSFAAVSYDREPEYATETFQYSEAPNGKSHYTHPLPCPVCNTNQKCDSQRTIHGGCYTVPNSYPLKSSQPQQQPQLQSHIPPSANAMPKAVDQKFQPQVPVYPKDYMKQIDPEYVFRNGYITNDQRNQNPNILLLRSRLMTRLTPPTVRESQMYKVAENRLFKMHHKRTPKFQYREYNNNNNNNNNNNDPDFYNKYPQDNQKQKELRLSEFPLSRIPWNNYWQKPERVRMRTKSKRRKRGDDYSWAEDFDNYNDYFDDPGGSDEYTKKQQGGNSKTSDLETPPSYDMFSELAKVVTDIIVTPSNTLITADDRKNVENMKSNQSSGSFTAPDRNSSKSVAEENTISEHSFPGSNNTTTPNTDLVTTAENSQPDETDNFGVSGSSVHSTTDMDRKGDKESSTSRTLNSGDEGQSPTTLKMASIAKGQKKLMTKPYPKIYNKVYPDWLGNEPLTSETVIGTKDAVATTTSVQTTTVQSSILRADPKLPTKLNLLAICEGYLEVIKLIKTQNLIPTKALDMNLAQYCENIISQNFNYQLDKSKKPESVGSSSPSPRLNGSPKFDEGLKPNPEQYNDEFEYEFSDVTDEPVTEKLNKKGKTKNSKRKKKNKKNHNSDGNTKDIVANPDDKAKLGKKKKWKNHSSEKREDREQQETITDTEESLRKRVAQEQIELLKLLRKRKKALLSWLLNSKEQEKTTGMQGTEYFQDDDDDYDENFLESSSDVTPDSGTVKPKRQEKTTGTTEKTFFYVNESIFPVYAKQYGYNSGGEVREVEVLWRKVNEKTHEKKIFKNVSVLALLLTSTNSPDMEHKNTKFVGSNGYESEDISETELKSDNKFDIDVANPKYKMSSTTVVVECKTDKTNKTSKTNKSNKSNGTSSAKSTKSSKKNSTHTYITKPDASTIIGKLPKVNKTNPNITHKTSHRFGAAKDFFQEYSIEFLDYAVYILPIMITILFLFCCLCCAVHIIHTGKAHKKKKKKIQISSEDTTETTDECEFETKKRKRKLKSNPESDGNLDFRRNKKFWHILLPKGNSETRHTKKINFLRFLKCKKDEGKICPPLSEFEENAKSCHNMSEGKLSCDSDEHSHSRGRRKEEMKHKTDGDNEATERRELMALLEELKKITEGKKEVKSVHVQYMSQEDENVFQRPEFSYPYEKNVFGLPKGYSFCSKQIPFRKTEHPTIRDDEFYDGVNELTELLPHECGYYAKENDYCDLRINQEGRCKRFLKVFRDSGVIRNKLFLDKNSRKNESENIIFNFNKYRSTNTDERDGLMAVTYKNAGTEARFEENESPFTLRFPNNADVLEEVENLKRQLNKKNVRRKDKGVLCRL